MPTVSDNSRSVLDDFNTRLSFSEWCRHEGCLPLKDLHLAVSLDLFDVHANSFRRHFPDSEMQRNGLSKRHSKHNPRPGSLNETFKTLAYMSFLYWDL